MIDVEVRNFQSIEHVSIRIDGFTALVGKSNIGKSAFVRAVKSALTGASGTSFVRHAPACSRRLKNAKTCECFSSVHIKTVGFDLKWEKGDKVNRYTFNGQVYDRTAQGTPDFLLRPQLDQDFGSVEIARTMKMLQFADQFDNVFLLDQGGTAVADVLSDVARLDRINVAMRLVEKDRKDAASTRKVREKDVQALTVRLSGFDGVDSVIAKVQQADDGLKQATGIQAKVESLTGYIEELRGLGFRLQELEKACSVQVPEVDPIIERHSAYENLTRFCLQANERASVVRALSGVEQIQDPNASPVAQRHGDFVQLEEWVSKLRSFQEVFAAAKPVEASKEPDLDSLRSIYDRFDKLSQLSDKMSILTKLVSALDDEDRKATQEERAIADAYAALGVCPTCDQRLQGEHSHAQRNVA